MGKFVAGNGQYVVYANSKEEASQILLAELDRVDKIKEAIANLLTKDGSALQNFLENMSEENLHIHFNDSTSLIYDKPENATIKGEVTTRTHQNGRLTYNLAYRYPNIQGHNADFRLAHEMGHLLLNPYTEERFVLDKETNTRQITGLIRAPRGQENNPDLRYGEQIQENAINLIAQLAIRGEHSADDIMSGNVDLTEYNSYKRCDDLVKLLAVSMRNDFDKEMSFEQLMSNKIDSMIEHADGTKEPANTFFYGILNDSSIIQKDFDKYMGEGAWKELNDAFTQLYDPNISQDRFENIYQTAQALIAEFAKARFQDKYQEAILINGENTPPLENKINMINQIIGEQQIYSQELASGETSMEFPEGYSINEFGEIIRPAKPENQNNELINENFSFKQRLAQLLQRSGILMNVPFVEKFVSRQLNVLPEGNSQRTTNGNTSRQNFMNYLSNNGEYRNLPPIQRMSDPERIARMQRKMQEEQQTDYDGR